MAVLVDAMHKGGPFMWPLLMLALMAPGIPLVLALLVGLRKWVPAVAWWLLPGAMLMVGAVGRIQGNVMVREAVDHASAETRSVLLHAGIGVATYTEWAAWAYLAPLLGFSALAAGLGLYAGAGQPSHHRPGLALAVLGAFLGGAALTGGLVGWQASQGVPFGLAGWALPLLLASGGLALALAVAGVADDPDHAARRAGGALLVVSLVAGSVAAAWMAGELHGSIAVHEAFAYASAETRSSMVAVGLLAARSWAWPGAAGLSLTVLVGIAVTVVSGLDWLRPRALASAGVTALLLAGVGLATGYAHLQAGDLEAQTTENRIAALLAVAGPLPRPVASGGEESADLHLLDFSESVLWQSGAWRLGPGSERAGQPLDGPLVASEYEDIAVAAPPELSASVLAQTVWAQADGQATGAHLLLLTRTGEPQGLSDSRWSSSAGVGALRIRWLPAGGELPDPGQPDDPHELERVWGNTLYMEERPGGVALHSLWSSADPVEDPGATLELLAREWPDLASADLLLVPGARWTVQDLVGRCLQARDALAGDDASYGGFASSCSLSSGRDRAFGRAQERKRRDWIRRVNGPPR